MNAIELLTQQHREVEEIFEKMESESDTEQLESLFARLADSLAVHARIEETQFYPASFAATPDKQEDLREAVEEHLAMKRTLAEMLEMDADEPEFEAKLKLLEEQVTNHVEEEEGELFPAVRESLAAQLDELGEKMEAMADELFKGEPRMNVLMETTAPPIDQGLRAA